MTKKITETQGLFAVFVAVSVGNAAPGGAEGTALLGKAVFFQPILHLSLIHILQEDQCLCHSFEVELLCPTFVAHALTFDQLCLNVNQFPDFIRFQCNRCLLYTSNPSLLIKNMDKSHQIF